jgi:type IV fimbrial biogenesis protein FimT
MPNKPITSSGLTLLELVTIVCIAGILMAIATPNFMQVITDNRFSTIANQLVTALVYARSEAIKRGAQVTIKPKGSTAQVWDEGWDVFIDNNANGTKEATEELLQAHQALPNGYTLRTGSNYGNWVAYLASGNIRSGSGFINDTFRLCDSSRDIKRSRAIIVKMGRVRTETGKVKECP